MDAEGEKLRGLILIELSLHQNRIGAEIDIPLLINQPTDDLGHFWMDHGFTTRDAHNWSPAFLRCSPTLLRCKPLIEHMIRILNLSAAGTGQIAAEERLQHQHERIPLYPTQLLGKHILRDGSHLGKWNGHSSLSFISIYVGKGGNRQPH